MVEFGDRLGYRFADAALLERALTHSSYAYEHGEERKSNNETLEFLGDAVLGLVVGHLLFRRFPEMQEGELSHLRSALVHEGHLARMAQDLDLGRYLLLGKGERLNGGAGKPSILACAYEALIGALFEDGGYQVARQFIEHHFSPWVEQGAELAQAADGKSRLQEILQGRYNQGPEYILRAEEGPDHDKRFTVSVCFRGTELGTGTAHSKKEAEKRAAAVAVARLAEREQMLDA